MPPFAKQNLPGRWAKIFTDVVMLPQQ